MGIIAVLMGIGVVVVVSVVTLIGDSIYRTLSESIKVFQKKGETKEAEEARRERRKYLIIFIILEIAIAIGIAKIIIG